MRYHKSLDRYFYEYLIHRALTDLRHIPGQSDSHVPLTVQRRLRDAIAADVDAQIPGGLDGNGDSQAIGGALHRALTARVGEVYGPDVAAAPGWNDGQWFDRIRREWRSLVSLDRTNGVLALTPTDPRWRDTETMRRLAGENPSGQLGWLAEKDLAALYATDVGSMFDLTRLTADNPGLTHNPSIRRTGDYTEPADTWPQAGPARTWGDVADVTRFARFTTADDYEYLVEHVTAHRRDRITTVDLDRAEAVLDHLQRQGHTISWAADTRTGIVHAVLDSGHRICVWHPTMPETMGAQIRHNAHPITTRFSTPDPRGRGDNLLRPTPAQAIALVDDALGTTPMAPTGASRRQVDASNQRGTWRGTATMTPVATAADGRVLHIRREHPQDSKPMFFADADRARDFLTTICHDARTTVHTTLDAERIIADVAALPRDVDGHLNPDDRDRIVVASDPALAGVQRAWIDLLDGRDLLVDPGHDRATIAADVDAGTTTWDTDPRVGHGPAADQILRHRDLLIDHMLGHSGLDPADPRFTIAPSAVVTHARDDLTDQQRRTALQRACRMSGVNPDQVDGDTFADRRFADALLRFNPSTARTLGAGQDNPFWARIHHTVVDTLSRCGVNVDQVRVDDHGVLLWRGTDPHDQRHGTLHGQIGQIIEPDEQGIIHLDQAGSDGISILMPVLEGTIVPPDPERPEETLAERVRVTDHHQRLHRTLAHQLIEDVTCGHSTMGEPVSLNRALYRSALTHPIPPGAPDEVVRTLAGRVRFSDDLPIITPTGGHRDPNPTWGRVTGEVLLGDRELAQVAAWEPGFFDPHLTHGSTHQGRVVYLTADAHITPDGRIHPGDPNTPTGRHCQLMTTRQAQWMRHNSADRIIKGGNALLQAVDRGVHGTAFVTVAGLNDDDAYIISADMAHAHPVTGADGTTRPLAAGDKLADLHGNKGVIARVIDRTVDPASIDDDALRHVHELFAANPHLDVCASPFSLIGRTNPGVIAEARDQGTWDLHLPGGLGDGRGSLDHGVGSVTWLVQNRLADVDASVHDDNAADHDQGRRFGAQAAWVLDACTDPTSAAPDAFCANLFAGNDRADQALREHLRTLGIWFSADGVRGIIGVHTDPDAASRPTSGRRIIDPGPPPPISGTQLNRRERRAMRRTIAHQLDDHGGELAVPFPLHFDATGQTVPRDDDGTWRIPVLSASLRTGQTLADGTTHRHDYTDAYVRIADQCWVYRDETARAEASNNPAEQQTHLDRAADAQRRAQQHFSTLQRHIDQRVFTGKNNQVKQRVLSARLPRSATLTAIPNTGLSIDEIGISPNTARTLGVHDDQTVAVWRDPVLRPAGVQARRVRVDPGFGAGISLHPNSMPSFDGDFDGDQLGVYNPASEQARADLDHILGPHTTIGDRDKPGFETGLTVGAVIHADPDLAAELDAITDAIAARHEDRPNADPGDHRDWGRDLVKRTSTFLNNVAAHPRATGLGLTFGGPGDQGWEDHLASVRAVCVDTGAKGSDKHLQVYRDHINGTSAHTQEQIMRVQQAMALKGQGAGPVGVLGQEMATTFREHPAALRASLDLQHMLQEGVMKSKNNPDIARQRFDIINGPMRTLLHGREITAGAGGWRGSTRGPLMRADAWVDAACDLMASPTGFAIGEVADHRTMFIAMAKILKNPETGMMRDMSKDPDLAPSALDEMAYNHHDGVAGWIHHVDGKSTVWTGRMTGYAGKGTRAVLADIARGVDREARLPADVDATNGRGRFDRYRSQLAQTVTAGTGTITDPAGATHRATPVAGAAWADERFFNDNERAVLAHLAGADPLHVRDTTTPQVVEPSR